MIYSSCDVDIHYNKVFWISFIVFLNLKELQLLARGVPIYFSTKLNFFLPQPLLIYFSILCNKITTFNFFLIKHRGEGCVKENIYNIHTWNKLGHPARNGQKIWKLLCLTESCLFFNKAKSESSRMRSIPCMKI